MKELEKYKKYIGKYVRNKYGIAKIIDVYESNGFVILKLDKQIVYFEDIRTGKIEDRHLIDTYPITKYTRNLERRIKELKDLLEVGDIIRYRINNISTTLETKGFVQGIVDISDDEMIENIKKDKNYIVLSITIPEQFEKIEYKVNKSTTEDNIKQNYISKHIITDMQIKLIDELTEKNYGERTRTAIEFGISLLDDILEIGKEETNERTNRKNRKRDSKTDKKW